MNEALRQKWAELRKTSRHMYTSIQQNIVSVLRFRFNLHLEVQKQVSFHPFLDFAMCLFVPGSPIFLQTFGRAVLRWFLADILAQWTGFVRERPVRDLTVRAVDLHWLLLATLCVKRLFGSIKRLEPQKDEKHTVPFFAALSHYLLIRFVSAFLYISILVYKTEETLEHFLCPNERLTA